MNKIQVDDLVYENFTFTLRDTDDGIMISCDGTIDMEYPQTTLDTYFGRIHEAVINNKIKTVYCDLTQLLFINSSGIRCLIKWLMRLKDIKDSKKRYNMIFLISKEYEWQHSSLGFLKELCPDLIQLKEV
jgi:hypothetical protein